jgi:hypothetical protein
LPDEKVVYIATHYTSVKAANLTQEQYVILSAGNADDTIILEGEAHLITDTSEKERANQLWMKKYVDPHTGTKATIGHPDDRIYRVEVQRIMAWEYGIVATRTDWKFDR